MSIRFRPLAGMVRLLPASLTWLLRFRPLTGMVPALRTALTSSTSFRPLTGMVLMLNLMKKSAPFSPPYGDGTYYV